jgi:hypothetical protein
MVAAGPELPKPVDGWADAIVVVIPFLILRAAELFFHPFLMLCAGSFPDRNRLQKARSRSGQPHLKELALGFRRKLLLRRGKGRKKDHRHF